MAAAKAFIPTNPISGSMSDTGATKMPATAEIDAEMAQTIE
jgi:hypothetical protein